MYMYIHIVSQKTNDNVILRLLGSKTGITMNILGILRLLHGMGWLLCFGSVVGMFGDFRQHKTLAPVAVVKFKNGRTANKKTYPPHLTAWNLGGGVPLEIPWEHSTKK